MNVEYIHTSSDCGSHTILLNDLSGPNEETCSLNLIENNNNSNVIFENNAEQATIEKLKGKISINEILVENQRKKLVNLIFEYEDVFDENPGLIKDYEYELRLKDDSQFFIKTYPVPLKYEEKVDKEIQKMLELGLISLTNSNFINPS